jgi:hypothetical protein
MANQANSAEGTPPVIHNERVVARDQGWRAGKFGQVLQRGRRIDGRHRVTIDSRVNRLLGDFIQKMVGA